MTISKSSPVQKYWSVENTLLFRSHITPYLNIFHQDNKKAWILAQIVFTLFGTVLQPHAFMVWFGSVQFCSVQYDFVCFFSGGPVFFTRYLFLSKLNLQREIYSRVEACQFYYVQPATAQNPSVLCPVAHITFYVLRDYKEAAEQFAG